MKLILSYAFLAVLVSVPVSAQSRLKLPPNLFAAGPAVAGRAPWARRPVRAPDAAGPRVSLTLEDAVKRALENNLDIAIQRINQQTYDVSIASIRSVYSPVLTSTVNTQTSKNPSTTTIAGAATGTAISNDTFVFNGG